MSLAVIEKLERHIEALEAKQMAQRYGISAGTNLLLVVGDDTVSNARERRLQGVPANVAKRVKLQPIVLPWLNKRALGKFSSEVRL